MDTGWERANNPLRFLLKKIGCLIQNNQILFQDFPFTKTCFIKSSTQRYLEETKGIIIKFGYQFEFVGKLTSEIWQLV